FNIFALISLLQIRVLGRFYVTLPDMTMTSLSLADATLLQSPYEGLPCGFRK
ncbi:MAG: hypothetical protein RL326_2171, partial [Pseudomonadota bacterium]